MKIHQQNFISEQNTLSGSSYSLLIILVNNYEKQYAINISKGPIRTLILFCTLDLVLLIFKSVISIEDKEQDFQAWSCWAFKVFR